MICILSSSLLSSAETKDELYSKDKGLHFLACFGLNTFSYASLRQYTLLDKLDCHIIATSIAMGIGIAKELHDDVFSNMDLLADALGVSLSIPICIYMDRERRYAIRAFLFRNVISLQYILMF